MTPAQIRALIARHVTISESGCWQWTGFIRWDGYGILSTAYRYGLTTKAHRLSYIGHVGPVGDELQIDHLCRNRACCNPAHLEAVTPRVNWERSTNHIVANLTKTHCPKGHPYDDENTYRTPGRPSARHCIACRADHRRAYRDRAAARKAAA